jgi:hypothetical protein
MNLSYEGNGDYVVYCLRCTVYRSYGNKLSTHFKNVRVKLKKRCHPVAVLALF